MKITTLLKPTTAIALVLMTLASCATDEAGTTTPPIDTDPLAQMDPNTPVILSTLLPRFDAAGAGTRAITNDELAAISATGELTLATIIAKDGVSVIASNRLQMPGSSVDAPRHFHFTGCTIGSLGTNAVIMTTGDNGGVTPIPDEQISTDGKLYLRHFNLQAEFAGKKQSTSKIAILNIASSNREDQLIGYGRMVKDASTTPATAKLAFALNHMGAKLSVLIQTTAGIPIAMDATGTGTDISGGTGASQMVKLVDASVTLPTTSATASLLFDNGTGKTQDLYTYLSTPDAKGDYPTDPADDAIQTVIAGNIAGDMGSTSYALAHPTTVPAGAEHLLNTLVPASASGVTYGTNDVLAITLDNNGTKTTYKLLLNKIDLGSGKTLTSLAPGDHLVLTLTVDPARQLISGTATIGEWSTATGDQDFVKDESKN